MEARCLAGVRWSVPLDALQVPLAVEPVARVRIAAAGSLVLRRMDRRGHKRGLVRDKKHGTKSGSAAPFQRGFFFLDALRKSCYSGRRSPQCKRRSYGQEE